jgi:hypothetical protein
VIIILIGLGVAFIVFAIIMPIYQIAELGWGKATQSYVRIKE